MAGDRFAADEIAMIESVESGSMSMKAKDRLSAATRMISPYRVPPNRREFGVLDFLPPLHGRGDAGETELKEGAGKSLVREKI